MLSYQVELVSIYRLERILTVTKGKSQKQVEIKGDSALTLLAASNKRGEYEKVVINRKLIIKPGRISRIEYLQESGTGNFATGLPIWLSYEDFVKLGRPIRLKGTGQVHYVSDGGIEKRFKPSTLRWKE